MTIRATPRKASASTNLREKASLETVVEDYSDLVQEGESDPFEGKIRSFKVSSHSSASNDSAVNGPDSRLSTSTSQKIQSGKAPLRPEQSTTSSDTQYTHEAESPLPASPSKVDRTSSPPSIDKYSEREIDDYSDVFGKAVGGSQRESRDNPTL